MRSPEGYYRALFSATVTLTLAILGRSAQKQQSLSSVVETFVTPQGCAQMSACSSICMYEPSFQLAFCACSSLLPVPYAFSKTGVLLGILVMLVVAGSNCLTSLLLLKAAGKTGRDSYEGMALAIGGPTWKASETYSWICACCSSLSCQLRRQLLLHRC